jgi:hypothetical protein
MVPRENYDYKMDKQKDKRLVLELSVWCAACQKNVLAMILLGIRHFYFFIFVFVVLLLN